MLGAIQGDMCLPGRLVQLAVYGYKINRGIIGIIISYHGGDEGAIDSR